jgi:hypothetical protein
MGQEGQEMSSRKDKEAFEKWCVEKFNIAPELIEDFRFSFTHKLIHTESAWQAACEYMRNRSPLDPVSLYDKLEQERDRSEILVEALEKLSLYVSYNGDTWVKELATEALKKYRGEI